MELIRSGGQTGADRGALDAAIALHIRHDGWCPKGRKAEDGPIPHRYHLTETPSADYQQRTDFNVRDSDGTLIICRYPLAGGSMLTRDCCKARSKHWMLVELDAPKQMECGFEIEIQRSPQDIYEGKALVGPGHDEDEEVLEAIGVWLRAATISTLNVAGNRESECPGLAQRVKQILMTALQR